MNQTELFSLLRHGQFLCYFSNIAYVFLFHTMFNPSAWLRLFLKVRLRRNYKMKKKKGIKKKKKNRGVCYKWPFHPLNIELCLFNNHTGGYFEWLPCSICEWSNCIHISNQLTKSLSILQHGFYLLVFRSVHQFFPIWVFSIGICTLKISK